ncbi:MAG: signal peptidase I [bacterium]|nr:signal peptidase I [bacterium]
MKKLMKKIQNNKMLLTLTKIAKIIIYVILIALLFVIVVQKVSKNNLSIGGIKIFTVITGSMKPEYVEGDMLVSKVVDPSTIKIGDNVVYHGEKGDMAGLTVTHKVIDIRKENGKYFFKTKGTSNEIEDPEISESQLYGKIIYKMGFLSFLSRIMLNIYVYYTLVTIMGLLVSIQVVKIIYDKDEDEQE